MLAKVTFVKIINYGISVCGDVAAAIRRENPTADISGNNACKVQQVKIQTDNVYIQVLRQ